MALATILLPVIGGPIFRWTVKTFHRNRIYLRPLAALLLLGAYAALDYYIPSTPYWYLFGFSFGSVAGYTLIRASYTGKDQLLWCAYSVIFAASFTMDEIVGPLGNVGLCGYMSLTYLILVYLRPEVKQFVGHRLAQLPQKEKVMKRLPTTLCEWLGRLRALISDRRAQKVMAIIVYYGLAVLLYFYLSKIGSLCFFCIPHFVFSTNRVIRSFFDISREPQDVPSTNRGFRRLLSISQEPQDVSSISRVIRCAGTREFLPHWLIYAVIFWLSFTVTFKFPVYALTSFLPMAYLFSFWVFLDHKPFYNRQKQHLGDSFCTGAKRERWQSKYRCPIERIDIQRSSNRQIFGA